MKQVKYNVTIKRKESLSLYAKAGKNIEFLNNNPSRIGSSSTAVQRMMLHETELRLLMPNIIGLDPKDVMWGNKTNEYLHSISVPIQMSGKLLNLNLNFDIHDMLRKENITNLASDLGSKLDDVDSLIAACTEKTLHKGAINEYNILRYANPENAGDYLLYLYILGYSQVANKVEDVDKSQNIRFYIHREVEELAKREVIAKLRTKVAVEYAKIANDHDKLKTLYAIYNEEGIMAGTSDVLNVDISTRIISLSDAMTHEPGKVLAILKDKEFTLKGVLLTYVTSGVMSVVPNTTTILDIHGDELGTTLGGAIKAYRGKTETYVKECNAALKAALLTN